MIDVKVMLRLGYETIRSGSVRFFVNSFGLGLFLFLALWLMVSLKAALVVLAIQVLVFIAALVVTATQIEKLLDIRLEPWPVRGAVNHDQITRLADDLAALGFIPAGRFKVVDKDLFIEGFARPDWKIYAMITSGTETTDAYLEFGADYIDGGHYCVSGGKMRDPLPRPANMIQVNCPGKSAEELLGIMLRCRPDHGLSDAPPENFRQNIERNLAVQRQFILKHSKR